ncbi:hypothetical protein D3C86_2066970 [compost metagenome]
MYLYMDIGVPNLLIVRTRADHTFVENEKLVLSLVMQKVLFFDKDSKENLMY